MLCYLDVPDESMRNSMPGSDQRTWDATFDDKYGVPQLCHIPCVDILTDRSVLEVSKEHPRSHQGQAHAGVNSCQAVGIIYDILQLMTFLEWAGE